MDPRFSEDYNSKKADPPKPSFGASILLLPVLCFAATFAYLNPNLVVALTERVQTMLG